MENELVFARKRFDMDKFSSQIKIQTEDTISKVLNVSLSAFVGSAEFSGGYVSASGKLKASVIYLNSEGEICNAEATSEIMEKQQASFALENCYGEDDVKLSGSNFSGGEVICFAEHNVSVYGNFKYEISKFSSEEGDLVLSKQNFSALKLVGSADDNFVVAEEVESNTTSVEVLSSSAKAQISEVSCLVDKVVVEGKVLAEIIFKDAENISSSQREFEFKQEFACGGTLPSNVADVKVLVKNATVTPEASEDKTTFVCVFDLFAKAYVYEENSYETVTDLFSLKNELQTTYSYIEMKNYVGAKNFNDSIMEVSDVSSLENFDDIIGVFEPKFDLESTELDGDKYLVAGKISSLVLYKSTEGEVSSYNLDVDFKTAIPTENGLELRDVLVIPAVSSFKVKAGKDLEVYFSVNITAKFETSVSGKFVKDFEEKEAKQNAFSGIKVYITSNGETLFDIARSLNVRPEVISSQNEVAESFEQGEKIYIYSPANLA